MSGNNSRVISTAKPHTIKKFELIERYIESWAQKLLQYERCNTIAYIDCMCNSGSYVDEAGMPIDGSPIRVANVLDRAARKYPDKIVELYFNDSDKDKTDHLISLLQKMLTCDRKLSQSECILVRDNLHIRVTHKDRDDLLREMAGSLSRDGFHYFLLYDPYDASINWAALYPFFLRWGEVLINHMASDPIRAIERVTNVDTKHKYEMTYLADFNKLVPLGKNIQAYEKRVEEIIASITADRNYYVAAFPFFNRRNALIYDLILCTSNLIGFKLYKKTVWNIFGGQSSSVHSAHNGDQLGVDTSNGSFGNTDTDETCYVVTDIAKYLSCIFSGQENVPLSDMWERLDKHPIFPSDGYRREIKKALADIYGAVFNKKGDFSTVTFQGENGEK